MKTNKRKSFVIVALIIFILSCTGFFFKKNCFSDEIPTKPESACLHYKNKRMSIYTKATVLYQSKTERYSITNLFGNNNDNVWATRLREKKESDEGDIFIIFAETQTINSISITNGLIKNKILFNSNARVKNITLYFFEDTDYDKRKPILNKEITLQDTINPQEISLKEISNKKIKGINISINTFYPGTKYSDICLTKLEINSVTNKDKNENIGDNYLIDQNLIEDTTDWSGFNIFFSGMAFLKNNSLNEVILVQSYGATYKTNIHHFYINNIPEDLIQDHIKFVRLNNRNVDVLKTYNDALKNATQIDQDYFISDKGFKLGIDKKSAIAIYGEPDKIQRDRDIEVCTWVFFGKHIGSEKDINVIKKKIINNSTFRRFIKIYFKNNKAFYLSLLNELP